MPSPVQRGVRVVSMMTLAAALSACQESRTFTPVGPGEVAERIARAISESPFVFPQAIAARRYGEQSGFIIYQGENPSLVYAVDWTSAANNVTIALHRRGPAGELDGPQLPPDDCTIPSLSFGGTAIGAALPRPLCPIVLSNTSGDKPKALEVRNLPPGEYSFVVTNNGPGNETIRTLLLEN